MPLLKRLILIFAHIMCMAVAHAQRASYNLNKTNGLPSNRVYSSLVDHNGYLWLCTESGVLKYNGYSIRKFDFNDGLPNIDVWHLHEDNHHRIILSCFNKIPGYIKDDKYYSFAIKGFDSSVQYIAPKFFYHREDTLWFYNQTSSWNNSSTAYITGDTVYHVQMPGIRQSNNAQAHPSVGVIYTNNDFNSIYNFKVENNKYTNPTLLCGNLPKFIADYIHLSPILEYKNKLHLFDLDTKIMIHSRTKQKTYYIDFANCVVDSLKIMNRGSNIATPQNIIWSYPYDQYHTALVTQDSVYAIDTGLNIRQFSYEELSGQKNLKGTYGYYAIYDTVWGRGLCTPNNGVFLSMAYDNLFEKASFNFAKSIYLGRENDSTSLWLDKNTRQIKTLCNDKITGNSSLPYFKQLLNIKSLTTSKMLIFENNSAYLYDKKSQQAYVPRSSKYTITYEGKDAEELDMHFLEELFPSIKSVVSLDSNNIVGVSGALNGLYHFRFVGADTFNIKQINTLKYNQVCWSEPNNTIIAHNDFNITLYNIKTEQAHTISLDLLKANGLHQIKKIFADKFGNIFIQDYDQLLLVNLQKLTLKRVLAGYNLEGAIVDLLNDKLTIGGSFGVAQYTILGLEQLSKPKVYPNTKGLLYNYLVNMNVSSNIIAVGTDNGSFFIHTNLTQRNEKSTSSKYLLAIYNGKTTQLNKEDTLQLSNKNRTFSLDVINPAGYGKLSFSYQLPNSSQWISNNSANVNLQQLRPNKYHTIKIRAADYLWKSEVITLHIFITPKWWQTRYGLITIGLSSILFITVLVFVISVVTQKRVQLKNEKTNKQRDLELKSIYSQINPHFIFNTLSTALFFVKRNQNQEAAKHISQFSELLRAYLKSSRNKYISIAEEVENLDNYLQLQMSRFDEKMQYEIVVDEDIDAEKVNIPSLLLQPIVENSLNHGIFHKSGLGEVTISFKKGQYESETICIVDDNGIGRKKAKTLRNTTKADSYGTILIEELIETFNKYEPVEIKLEYVDKVEPNTGTTVIITIKEKPNGK